MLPRNVAFVGAICVTIGWLLASTLAPPVARVQSLPQERTPRREAAADVPIPEQLQLRVRDVPPTPERRRNPFVFATRERIEPASSPLSDSQPALQIAAPVPAATAPTYILSGIGTTGDVRTAVLTTGDDVRIVRIGDRVGELVVTDISDSSVTLSRGTERVTLRFAQ